MAGRGWKIARPCEARLAVKVNSEIGRTEYLLVGLVEVPDSTGRGPAPDTTSRIRWARLRQRDDVQPRRRLHHDRPSRGDRPGRDDGRRCSCSDASCSSRTSSSSAVTASVWTICSASWRRLGVRAKFLAVGSLAGLEAAKRGECDIAGIHLLDPQSGEYNRPFLTPELALIPGYGRLQGIVYRKGDSRFEGRTAEPTRSRRRSRDPSCVMVNRNQGSGTRALIDRLLGGSEAARLRRAAAQSQRRCGRGRAAPRRLGCHARHDRAQRGAWLHPGAARAVRLRVTTRARRSSRRQGVRGTAWRIRSRVRRLPVWG